MDKFDELLNQKTIGDVVLIGYMMFLNDKKLLEEADKYVNGFVRSIKNEQFAILAKKNREALEHIGEKK